MALFRENEASSPCIGRLRQSLTSYLPFAEGDERVKVESETHAKAAISGATARNDTKGGGLGRTMGGYIDDTFNWDDISWLRKSTTLPIIAKGIQTAEDAVLAMNYGLDGIIVTNHGGRNLDT